jgi:two-component system, OmpR family, phosphate regulon sensor histidine kinase PhoR
MMKNRKIGIILLLVIFLPALFFSVYEIGSLNQNEKIIEEIYSNQLEVILSSVNQYSQDVASNWSINMNNVITTPQHNLYTALRHFSLNNPSMKGVFYITDSSCNNIEVVLQDYSLHVTDLQNTIKGILRENTRNINRLYGFIEKGYRKIESLYSSNTPNLAYFVFIGNDYNGNKIFCGMIIDAKGFVNQVLSPKIQAIIEERFIISVIDDQRNRSVYVSEPTHVKRLSKVKPLWLLPHYKLGIIYKGRTIEQLVRERTYLNFSLIILLDILFLTGTWYVFRSIKTQIQLAQMRADFISNVSHEIRTPLALISVYIETILLGRLKNEKLQEYYQIIYQETNRLTDIVNKILNFSKIEEKKYNYNFTEININDIIENVLLRFDYHLKNKNFQVEVHLSPALPAIRGDREALFEVFMNLVDNAIKYSKDEKFIGLATKQEGTKIIAELTDKGIGIPESEQNYIFDKFFRVSNGDVQNIRGSGLGLAIVKHIMDSHNATINLFSIPGKGSTFKLTFFSTDMDKMVGQKIVSNK